MKSKMFLKKRCRMALAALAVGGSALLLPSCAGMIASGGVSVATPGGLGLSIGTSGPILPPPTPAPAPVPVPVVNPTPAPAPAPANPAPANPGNPGNPGPNSPGGPGNPAPNNPGGPGNPGGPF